MGRDENRECPTRRAWFSRVWEVSLSSTQTRAFSSLSEIGKVGPRRRIVDSPPRVSSNTNRTQSVPARELALESQPDVPQLAYRLQSDSKQSNRNRSDVYWRRRNEHQDPYPLTATPRSRRRPCSRRPDCRPPAALEPNRPTRRTRAPDPHGTGTGHAVRHIDILISSQCTPRHGRDPRLTARPPTTLPRPPVSPTPCLHYQSGIRPCNRLRTCDSVLS
jgi:hypothetical protein